MKTNILLKLLPLLLLISTACEKSVEEIPAFDLHEEPSCVLTEELIESNTSHTFKNRLDYVGSKNQLAFFWAYVLDPATSQFITLRDYTYLLISHDTRGNIVKAESTGDFQGDTKAMHVFEYNDENLLTKWTYYTQIEGKLEESLNYTFEYASPTQLKN